MTSTPWPATPTSTIQQGTDTDHLLFRPEPPEREPQEPQGRRGHQVSRRLPGHRRHHRPRHPQGAPDDDPRRLPGRQHRTTTPTSSTSRRPRRCSPSWASPCPSRSRPWSGTCRPIPSTRRRSRRRWRRPASTSTCRWWTASSGSTATARTTSTSGWACGARTIPIRTPTPRPSPSTSRAIRRKKSSTLADRFGWNSGALSDQVLAAVQEQDTKSASRCTSTPPRRQADASPFVYMFQGARKVAIRSNVKGVVLGYHLLRRPLRRRQQGVAPDLGRTALPPVREKATGAAGRCGGAPAPATPRLAGEAGDAGRTPISQPRLLPAWEKVPEGRMRGLAPATAPHTRCHSRAGGNAAGTCSMPRRRSRTEPPPRRTLEPRLRGK